LSLSQSRELEICIFLPYQTSAFTKTIMETLIRNSDGFIIQSLLAASYEGFAQRLT